MIDSIISYFINTPYLIKHAYHRLKPKWMWLVIPFIASAIVLLIMMMIFNMNGIEEIKQARGFFRLAAVTSFAYMWIAIYQSYNTFKHDYFTGKLFNLNPIFQNVIIALLFGLTMFISLVMIVLATPVNIESSILSILFFVVMSIIFMVVISTLLGLIAIMQNKLNMTYFVVSIIMFFIVPIVFIPNTNTTLIVHILMLNPLYYLIEGISQSVVLGALSLNNIPHHIYYILCLAILCVIIYALYRYIAHKKYAYAMNHTQQVSEHRSDEQDYKSDE
ncbi:sugar ABC transporter permease [Staphylococcus edaphicus]|uniref:Sugar ABC transporter permease n=1 Tax=Staphylococcus edaphicus TaxID=1955013 RepID=A0A2C6WP17_9STAP|nr:sugar ABC transporter permease [Staphylococcus edaphicus]PHK49544.1 sugar ABC transporter permease [Staphylococcus edaphicus]UQW82429.1 sugar ABC transporter permease [Staphylococcus edaphicus]